MPSNPATTDTGSVRKAAAAKDPPPPARRAAAGKEDKTSTTLPEEAPGSSAPRAKTARPVKDAAPEPTPAKKPAAPKTATKAAPVARTGTAAPKTTAKARPAKTAAAPEDRFLTSQRAALEAERATYVEQAASLRAEAESLVFEMEPGDVQFDDESGEGGTVTVDRERDLALSAQALLAVEEIDHAVAKIATGRYGLCEACGEPIAHARLDALPYARLCISCKSGGLSRR